MSRLLVRAFAGWRTALSGPVILVQAGTAVNYFGYGPILPFEIVYLHHCRGFPTATAGLVLAAALRTQRLAPRVSIICLKLRASARSRFGGFRARA